MPDFAIISPKLGIDESTPTVLLSEAFLAKGSQNVRYHKGRYDRIRGRLPQLYDSEEVQIQAPTDVYVITAINTVTKKLTVTGDVLSGNTTLADGDTIRINGGTTEANNITFTVDGDPTYAAPNSTVYVTETIAAAGVTPGNLFIGGTEVIKYHRHITQKTGTEHLLLGTKYHILLWLQADRSLTVKWTTVTPANVYRWEIVDHLRNVVATNNSDFVLWWDIDDSAANDFVALGEADGIDYEGTANRLTKAKHVTSYERYLILGYTTENGISYPQRERWASLGTGGDDIDFDENGDGDAGAKEFTNTPGSLMGFARHGDDLVISKQDSMYKSWAGEGDIVFVWDEYTLKVGNLSADSLVNDKAGRLYWAGSDFTIREIQTPQPISTAVDDTIRGMNVEFTEYIQATYIEEYDEIWFAIPSSHNSLNDKIIAFQPNGGRTHIYIHRIRAFGDFTQQEVYTYVTLPFETYADWGADWLIYDTQRNTVGFPLDLGSDYFGYTFDLHRSELDNTSDFTGKIIISTTLTIQKSLHLFKRINNGCDLMFNRKSSGWAELYVKKDTERGWHLLGDEFLLTDDDLPEVITVHVPFDIRARSFKFKIDSSSAMEFLGLYFREFEFDGYR